MSVLERQYVVIVRALVEHVESLLVALMVSGSKRHDKHDSGQRARPEEPEPQGATTTRLSFRRWCQGGPRRET